MEISKKDVNEEVAESGRNARNVECSKCGSLVLRSGAAQLVADEPFDVPLVYQKGERRADDAFETESLRRWWLVDNMFTFENVGFTHAHNGRKYLACADCELGPIGLVDAENRYLIALDRISHK